MDTLYLNRILAQKKLLGLTIKSMAELSKLQLPEETISRFLSSKTHDPRLSTVLDVGEIVRLEPYELFMDAQTAAEFKIFLETRTSKTSTSEEINSLLSQNVTLQDEIAALKAEIGWLRLILEHKEEIIAIHNYYNNIKPNNKKEE